MNEIKVFENAMFGKMRTVLKEGQPWFVAADVCRALEIGNPTDALNRLEADERTLVSIEGASNGLPMNGINEPGLYALVLGSRKPEARAFKRWITHEVIPDIRRHGMYANEATLDRLMNDPDSLISALQHYRDEKQKRMVLEAQVEKDAPKVLFAESVEASQQSILIGELAKLLKQNGADIGQNRLFERLRFEGYLCSVGERRNLPTQKAMDMKLFEVKESTVNNPDGSIRLTRTTKVTGKGQIYFINKYRPDRGWLA